jgi:hypothetical protein
MKIILSELKQVIKKIIKEAWVDEKWSDGTIKQRWVDDEDENDTNKNKNVIRLPPKINDFEYGNFLFADPDVLDRTAEDVAMKKVSFKKNEYNKIYPPTIPREKNTDDEDAAIKEIQTYFNRKLGTTTVDDKFVNALIKLKDHYPKLLDPSLNTKYLYRGNSLLLNNVISYDLEKGAILNTKSEYHSQMPHYKIKINNFLVHEPREVRKLLSFSSNIDIGLNFALNVFNLPNIIANNLIPVLYVVKSNSENFILNPNFSNIISNYFEYESLHYGNQYNADEVYLIDPFDVVCKAIVEKRIKKFEEFEIKLPDYFELYKKIIAAETDSILLFRYQTRMKNEMKRIM